MLDLLRLLRFTPVLQAGAETLLSSDCYQYRVDLTFADNKVALAVYCRRQKSFAQLAFKARARILCILLLLTTLNSDLSDKIEQGRDREVSVEVAVVVPPCARWGGFPQTCPWIVNRNERPTFELRLLPQKDSIRLPGYSTSD